MLGWCRELVRNEPVIRRKFAQEEKYIERQRLLLHAPKDSVIFFFAASADVGICNIFHVYIVRSVVAVVLSLIDVLGRQRGHGRDIRHHVGLLLRCPEAAAKQACSSGRNVGLVFTLVVSHAGR